MSKLSISEILDSVKKAKTKKRKSELLIENDSNELRLILALTYDTDKYEFYLPNVRPPFTPSEFPDSHGMLYREARKLKYFLKGFAGDNINQVRREALFIQMLETVHKSDSEVLCNMIERTPFTGITIDLLNETFGKDFISTKPKTKKGKAKEV